MTRRTDAIVERPLADRSAGGASGFLELRLQASEVMAAEWVTPAGLERRLDARMMALPWNARLEALWSETKTRIITPR